MRPTGDPGGPAAFAPFRPQPGYNKSRPQTSHRLKPTLGSPSERRSIAWTWHYLCGKKTKFLEYSLDSLRTSVFWQPKGRGQEVGKIVGEVRMGREKAPQAHMGACCLQGS